MARKPKLSGKDIDFAGMSADELTALAAGATKAAEDRRKFQERKAEIVKQILKGLHELNDNGDLSDDLKAKFTTSAGKFSPHLFFSYPKPK